MTSSTKHGLLERLKQFGQEHLLAFWDELASDKQQALADQINQLDFEGLKKLAKSVNAGEDWRAVAARADAPPAFRLNADAKNPVSSDAARQRGRAALSAGEVGVILVAGGQGTRLGFDQPKGMFRIGPLSKATLFQILFEKLAAISQRHSVRVPIYLMTSPATHEDTLAYLDKTGRFGLPKEDVVLFCQGTMPALDASSGKILLAERHELFTNPDGHGGMLAALDSSGSLAEIERRGIKHLFYCQVDNPLVSMCDAEFLGYHLLTDSEISTQVVAKRTSRDKVGNVVTVDGKLRIIEYSDLNPLEDEIVERKTAHGSPIFWAGNTAVHVFDAAMLRRLTKLADSLPFHIAKKAVPHIDSQGNKVEPKEPNAIKFERFIFDLLPSARHGIVVEVDERTAFAPVKNAPGEARDTPEIVERQMIALHRNWLEAAGCKVSPDGKVEIRPTFALDAADVARKVPKGTAVTGDRLFE